MASNGSTTRTSPKPRSARNARSDPHPHRNDRRAAARLVHRTQLGEHAQAVIEEGGFLYSSDSYADDLPYWVNGSKGPHLIIPYTLDANDMRFINAQGFANGEEFFAYLRDTFDVLYAEGERAPKMMSVGLHCRLAGRPGRAGALKRFLDHIAAHDQRVDGDAASTSRGTGTASTAPRRDRADDRPEESAWA